MTTFKVREFSPYARTHANKFYISDGNHCYLNHDGTTTMHNVSGGVFETKEEAEKFLAGYNYVHNPQALMNNLSIDDLLRQYSRPKNRTFYHTTNDATFRTTMCAIIGPDNQLVGIGGVACGPEDTFSAAEGRRLAREKAMVNAVELQKSGAPRFIAREAEGRHVVNALAISALLIRKNAMEAKERHIMRQLEKNVRKAQRKLAQVRPVSDLSVIEGPAEELMSVLAQAAQNSLGSIDARAEIGHTL